MPFSLPLQLLLESFDLALDLGSEPFKLLLLGHRQHRLDFVSFAETWNGRLAMLGFVIGLATELLTGQGILSQIGLTSLFLFNKAYLKEIGQMLVAWMISQIPGGEGIFKKKYMTGRHCRHSSSEGGRQPPLRSPGQALFC
jgi:hypothetical protein